LERLFSVSSLLRTVFSEVVSLFGPICCPPRSSREREREIPWGRERNTGGWGGGGVFIRKLWQENDEENDAEHVWMCVVVVVT
jgi:hypothetical protein